MTQKIIYLEEIQKGTFMYTNICAQAWYDFKITLKDGKTNKIYFKGTKPYSHSGSIVNIKDKENFVPVEGDNLVLEITSDNSKELKTSINIFGVNDVNGRTVGKGYNICVEDSGDDDYNDLYINIISWVKKG